MQQILLLIPLFTGTLAVRQPTCPNDDLPKLDKSGRPIQCIPGSSSRVVCGDGYACFFSGVNYMCCPSNEPTIKSQIVCPGQSLTVLDTSGQPMKCNTWTYACPKASMACSLVGRDYICCEQIEGGSGSIASSRERRRRTKAPKTPSQPLECPSNSISLLNGSGLPLLCNSRNRCPNKAFCHPVGRQAICCESYDFASNILDNENNIRRSAEVKAPLQVLDRTMTVTNNAELTRSVLETPIVPRSSAEKETRPRNTIQLKQSLEKKAVVRTTSGTVEMPFTSSDAITHRSVPDSMADDGVAEMSSTRASAIPSTTEAVEMYTTTERIRAPPKRKPPAAFASVSAPQQGNELKTLNSNLPSQLFNGRDKRIMAEQFLMHQIRNGWPYDEKFYRSDVDAYSPQQRQRMAQIFFSDNQ